MLVFINYWIEKCTVKHWNSSLQFELVTESIIKTSLVGYYALLIGNLLQTSRWRFLPLQCNKEEVFIYPEYGGIKFLTKPLTNLQSAMPHTSQDCNLKELLSSQKRPYRLWVPPSLLLNWDCGTFAQGTAAGWWSRPINSHPQSRLKTSGATTATPIRFHVVHRRKIACNLGNNILVF